jgi:hypothetical protein
MVIVGIAEHMLLAELVLVEDEDLRLDKVLEALEPDVTERDELDCEEEPGDELDAPALDDDEMVDEELVDAPEVDRELLPLELLPETELDPELEEVEVANVFDGEDAGDALDEEPDVAVSLEVESDEVEEELSVVVDLNTPLYVVDVVDEEVTEHTSDEQHGTVVLVEELVEKTPPYPEGKQWTVCEWGFSPGLRKTPS